MLSSGRPLDGSHIIGIVVIVDAAVGVHVAVVVGGVEGGGTAGEGGAGEQGLVVSLRHGTGLALVHGIQTVRALLELEDEQDDQDDGDEGPGDDEDNKRGGLRCL